MKRQCQLMLFTICLSMTCITYAGVLAGLFTWLKNDKCAALSGHWIGNGEVDKGSTICYYEGDGILKLAPDNEQFTLNDGILTKQPGSSWLCPKQVPFSMSGTCENGTIIVTDAMYRLKGVMENTTAINLYGTALCNGYNLVVKSMHLQKA